MKKFDNIVMSDTTPSIYSIWLKNGKLFYFSNGTWVEISTATVTQTQALSETTKTDEE